MEAYVSIFNNETRVCVRVEFLQVQKGRRTSIRIACSGLNDNSIYKFKVKNTLLLEKKPRQQLIDAWENDNSITIFNDENKINLINSNLDVYQDEILIFSEKIKVCNKSWSNIER